MSTRTRSKTRSINQKTLPSALEQSKKKRRKGRSTAVDEQQPDITDSLELPQIKKKPISTTSPEHSPVSPAQKFSTYQVSTPTESSPNTPSSVPSKPTEACLGKAPVISNSDSNFASTPPPSSTTEKFITVAHNVEEPLSSKSTSTSLLDDADDENYPVTVSEAQVSPDLVAMDRRSFSQFVETKKSTDFNFSSQPSNSFPADKTATKNEFSTNNLVSPLL